MTVLPTTAADASASRAISMEATAPLAAAYAAGRSAWGGLAVSYPQFSAYAEGLELSGAAVTQHAVDLYLCAACAGRQPAAYQALEAAHFPALRAVLWRLLGDRSIVQEVLQELRIRLFVGSMPRIRTYRGSGSLSAWLRTVAVHAAHDHRRSSHVQRGRLRKLSFAQHTAGPLSHELPAERSGLFFGQPRERVVERACSAAIGTLERSQLQLLRHYFVGGLSIDALSPMYSVHRATIARRIRRAMEHIRSLVCQDLAARYQLSRREIDELVRESCGELELSGELSAGEATHVARGTCSAL
jgi:RNA polymerase sigma-70 factor, ECF subfamily